LNLKRIFTVRFFFVTFGVFDSYLVKNEVKYEQNHLRKSAQIRQSNP